MIVKLFRLQLGFLVLLSLYTRVTAQLVNITYDDTDEGFTYSGPWNFGPTCQDCSARPDSEEMWAGTWHDGSYFGQPSDDTQDSDPLTIDFPFSGNVLFYENQLYLSYALV